MRRDEASSQMAAARALGRSRVCPMCTRQSRSEDQEEEEALPTVLSPPFLLLWPWVPDFHSGFPTSKAFCGLGLEEHYLEVWKERWRERERPPHLLIGQQPRGLESAPCPGCAPAGLPYTAQHRKIRVLMAP